MNYFIQKHNNMPVRNLIIRCTDTGIREYVDFGAERPILYKNAFGIDSSKEECIRIHNLIPFTLSMFLTWSDKINLENAEVRQFIKEYLEELA